MLGKIYISFLLFDTYRPEEFTKTLGRRTPADRVQGTITLTITIIEPSSRPGELNWLAISR